MFDANDSVEITKDLLIALGLEIQKGTNNVYDQETKSLLMFDGKSIKANSDPNEMLYIDEHDIKLDPLNPKCTKMMEMLFGKFLEDSEEMGNTMHCISYYFDKDEEEKKYRLTVKFSNGVDNTSDWIGNWYYNKIICYLEAIFSIEGTFEDKDLRPYDIEQDMRD